MSPARPKLIDLFCKAGGASKGYDLAGFDVTGVDIEPQPRYPYRFVQADAMDVLAHWDLSPFAVIAASPPCQVFAAAATNRKRDDHPDLLWPVRDLIERTGKPYAIENVATAPMPGSLLLCGSSFGLPVIRHRRFWVSPDPILIPNMCPQIKHARGVSHGARFYPYAHKKWEAAWRKNVMPVVWPWMNLRESGQAVPPAYTQWIGEWLIEQLG